MFSWFTTIASIFQVCSAAIKAAHDLENGLSRHENRVAVATALTKMNTTKGDTSALDDLYNNASPR